MVNMSEEKSQQRKWTREEIVILVTEYFRTKNMLSSEIEESYHRISDFLRKKEQIDTGKPVSNMFRNYAGIRMQTARIKCIDPDTNLSGMKGTKLQKQIVNEFLQDPKLMYSEAEAIYKKYNG